MAHVGVWFDREGDFLEVRLVEAEGYFREIAEDVFERVDREGNVTGFATFNVTRRECRSIEIPLQLTVAG